MAQVKETINILVNILQLNGFSKCKPEYFRLAKFDNNETVEQFWNMLFEMTLFLQYGQSSTSPYYTLRECSKDVKVRLTKRSLQDMGYLSPQFSSLPADMTCGSRELLLAFAWVLTTQRVMDHIMEFSVSPLEKCFPSSTGAQKSRDRRMPDHLSVCKRLQRHQLLNGKLHLTLKHMFALHRESCRLQHKVHTCTEGVSVTPVLPHLRPGEVYLLQHPQHLNTMLEAFEKEIKMLNCVILWQEHEHNFWKWMESVLALKLQEQAQASRASLVHYNISCSDLPNLAQTRRQLETCILQLEPVISHLEDLWFSKQKEMHMSDAERLAYTVNVELNARQQAIGTSPASIHHQLTGRPVFVHAKPEPKQVNRVFIPELQKTESVGEFVNIETEIAKIQSEINVLELVIESKERFYKQKLDSLAARVPNSICIQPI
ncbi:tubulin epsilon and delta complex protein 1-like [Dreissena polymorpha]|nr:tubulin epsilon and delta complex protein 1-like [Dreissena polymorpha]